MLVQHKKERDLLLGLGVHNVYYYQEPVFKLVDGLKATEKECILLFDVDRKSNEKFKELAGLLKFLHEQVALSKRYHEGMEF